MIGATVLHFHQVEGGPKKMYRFENLFLAKLYFIFIESSETDFNLVASEIGAELNNLVAYGDILVNFLRILSTKPDYIQKLIIAKMWNFV